jgi:competence protein ComEC
MPLGLEKWALVAMAGGVDVVLWVARTVSGWPGAVVLLPAMPTWSLALITAGGLWLCLWRQRWRLLGLVPMAAGVAAMLTAQVPDVYIDGAGKLLAVRGEHGGLIVSSKIAGRSARESWLRRAGEESAAGLWPKPGSSGDDGLRCDSLGCVYRGGAGSARGRSGDAADPAMDQEGIRREPVVAIARRGEALADDCRQAHVVVSLVPVRGRCPSPATVVDRFDLLRNGAHAIWLRPDGIRVASVNGLRGDRPWVLRPPRPQHKDPRASPTRRSRERDTPPHDRLGAPELNAMPLAGGPPGAERPDDALEATETPEHDAGSETENGDITAPRAAEPEGRDS